MLLLCCLLCFQDAPAFSGTDLKKTLEWINDLKLRYLQKTGNSLIDEENTKKYEAAIATMKGKKIRYTLNALHPGKDGVQLVSDGLKGNGVESSLGFIPDNPARGRRAYFKVDEKLIRKLRPNDPVILDGQIAGFEKNYQSNLIITRYKLSLPSP